MGILHKQAQSIINLLARAIGIAEGYSKKDTLTRLSANVNFKPIKQEVDHNLEEQWKCGIQNVLDCIKQYLDKAAILTDDDKYIYATVIALWIDRKISYENPNRDTLNIAVLLSEASTYSTITHLNSRDSVDETGIWICPKYPCIPVVYEIDDEGKERNTKLFNRDSFHFLNNALNNISYYCLDTKNIDITNIIIKCNGLKIDEDKYLRIAFAPMSSSKEMPFKLDYVQKNSEQFFQIEYIYFPDELTSRFNRDLFLSGINRANIIFFPEMLGVDGMIDEKDSFSHNLKTIGRELVQYGLSLPDIVIFPSIWKSRENFVVVANKNGRILAKQKKLVPYVDRDKGIENIEIPDIPEIILIHIPGVARIAIAICAQFLDEREENYTDFLCRCLGVNLVIVPSFSKGENDFKRILPSFRKYGTSVVWGNCCGAHPYNTKIIGGTDIVGLDETFQFGTYAKCRDFCCSNTEACIFTVDIPYRVNRKKLEKAAVPGIINHHYLSEQNGGIEL